MAYQVVKQPDGDLSLGNLRGELVNLNPAAADYATGGYLIEGIGETTESTGNVGLYKVLTAIPAGGQGGFVPVWNPTTSKLQIFESAAVAATPAAAAPLAEVAAGTDLSAYSFELLLIGL